MGIINGDQFSDFPVARDYVMVAEYMFWPNFGHLKVNTIRRP